VLGCEHACTAPDAERNPWEDDCATLEGIILHGPALNEPMLHESMPDAAQAAHQPV
jgi:hypothetical protein